MLKDLKPLFRFFVLGGLLVVALFALAHVLLVWLKLAALKPLFAALLGPVGLAVVGILAGFLMYQVDDKSNKPLEMAVGACVYALVLWLLGLVIAKAVLLCVLLCALLIYRDGDEDPA